MSTQITIRGLVQGVGFRPFVYRLAKNLGIKGTVSNRNNGVLIRTGLSEEQVSFFVSQIRNNHPPGAFIQSINIIESGDKEEFTDFFILPSEAESDEVTQVAPDIAVCDDCLEDRKKQLHRIGYPFINCTYCGPRFSIIRDLPYDRIQTTMDRFEMCSACATEYSDVNNRRFHAQPVACNDCGPAYYTMYKNKDIDDYPVILELSSRLLQEGKVIAVKGTGGYHLACDATNAVAVERLRKIKGRDTKPFAVMFQDVESLMSYVFLNEIEKGNLISWRRPIVLLGQHRSLNPGINPGMNTLGCMLPYMPIHSDWFSLVSTPALVMTSGNISDLPIMITPEEAEKQLRGKVDLLLHHNRPIYNRTDDSVLQVCGAQTCLIRRSRGYVPQPFFAHVEVEGILAFGAEKTNTFALGKKNTILQSQYIGDLKNRETLAFYTESLNRFQQLFRFTPSQLVCDLHPDYLSSCVAEQMATEMQIPLLKVQHHHAHAAACMLEYELHEPVIAVIWDGTGLGNDGTSWGGEFFLCNREQFTRLSHLEYMPMPGGDKVAAEPWRMAVACLYHYRIPFPLSLIERIGKEKIDILTAMIDKEINTPYTSSAGRLFDAFSSLLGICDIAAHQAEAAVLLEQAADENCTLKYQVNTKENTIATSPLFVGILMDIKRGIPVKIIAAKIHNSLSHLIFRQINLHVKQTGINRVVLSGGCFQNKRLVEQLQQLFSSKKIELYIPGQIPCNDSGIAVGQITVAAARMKESLKTTSHA